MCLLVDRSGTDDDVRRPRRDGTDAGGRQPRSHRETAQGDAHLDGGILSLLSVNELDGVIVSE